MKRRWVIAGLGGAIAALVILFVALSGPHEPKYQGKRLTAWLDDLRSPSLLARTNATLAIQQMGTNAIPFLIAMLHARDSKVKVAAMDLLSRQHWVRFHFRYDSDRRIEAYMGLAALGPQAAGAIPELAKLLYQPWEPRQAAYALHQIGTQAVPVLRQALNSTNSETRGEAVGWVGLSGPAANPAVPDLIAALKDRNFITRSKAAVALTRFPEQADIIVPALRTCLSDPDETFRMNAARALGRFGEAARPAIPDLMKMVTSTNYQESETATGVLMKLDPEAALTAFIANLGSEDLQVRQTTAWALMVCKAKGRPAVPALVKCLKDPDAKLKQNAAVALREIGQEPDLVVPALMENLNDPDLKVRSITAIALCSFGEKAKPAVPIILKLIEENKNDELTAGGLFNALARIDPAAAAKLNGE